MKHLTHLTLILFTLVYAIESKGQNLTDLEIAQQAFEGWHIGEKTGDYTQFKSLLSDSCTTFDHPFVGRHKDADALITINKMISEREQNPNALSFSEIKLVTNGNEFFFHFRSQGEVLGRFQFDGYNILAITVVDGNLTGFREYLGFIDPEWFKS